MKMRILLFFFLVVGIVACTRKSPCSHYFFRPQTCNLHDIPMNHTDEGGLEHTDSMYLNLILAGENINNCAVFPSFSLGTELMADPIIALMKWEKSLVSFEITSNADFNDIPAGQSLKSKLWGFDINNQKITVDEALLPYKRSEYEGLINYSYLRFQFTESPQEPLQTFHVVLTLADGRVLETTSAQVEWK